MSRRQRQIVTAVTLVVLVGLLAGGSVLGYRALVTPFTPEAGDEPACTSNFRIGQTVKSTRVKVSVFNGGTREGLASDVRASLTKRGFKRGEVGNAPPSIDDVRFVRVFARTADDPRARLVARQFGKNTQIEETESPLGQEFANGVEVVVGDAYVRLTKAPRSVKVTSLPDGCEPAPAARDRDRQ